MTGGKIHGMEYFDNGDTCEPKSYLGLSPTLYLTILLFNYKETHLTYIQTLEKKCNQTPIWRYFKEKEKSELYTVSTDKKAHQKKKKATKQMTIVS